MRCVVRYRHPVTGNVYYFKDYRSDGDNLKPVGCFLYHRVSPAMVFASKKEAAKVVSHLTSIGYENVVVVPPRRVKM